MTKKVQILRVFASLRETKKRHARPNASTAEADKSAFLHVPASFMASLMGGKRIRTMSDFVRHRFDIELTCACGHRNVLSSRAVWQIFRKKGWSPTLERAPSRFRCTRCGGRPVRIGPWEA